MVYSKPLGGKSRIVKLVREMKKKNWFFYLSRTVQRIVEEKNERD